jgi:metal-responsive CopG/Arc/MetJ family transcriptional regulator
MSQEKKAVSVRVNKELMDEIERVKEDTGMSQSDTTRELIREGIRAREAEKEREDIKERLGQLDERLREIERHQSRSTLSIILDRILR